VASWTRCLWFRGPARRVERSNLAVRLDAGYKGLGAIAGLTSLSQHFGPGGVADIIFARHFRPKGAAVLPKRSRGLETHCAGFNEGQVWRLCRLFHSRKVYARKNSIALTRKRPRAGVLRDFKKRFPLPGGVLRYSCKWLRSQCWRCCKARGLRARVELIRTERRAAYHLPRILARLNSTAPARLHPRPGRMLDRRSELGVAPRFPTLSVISTLSLSLRF
jgi:hypothetical protein